MTIPKSVTVAPNARSFLPFPFCERSEQNGKRLRICACATGVNQLSIETSPTNEPYIIVFVLMRLGNAENFRTIGGQVGEKHALKVSAKCLMVVVSQTPPTFEMGTTLLQLTKTKSFSGAEK